MEGDMSGREEEGLRRLWEGWKGTCTNRMELPVINKR